LESISVSGGKCNDTWEVGLQYARREAQNCKGIPLSKVFFIGDNKPNTREEVDSIRKQNPNFKSTKFEEPAYWVTELDKLRDLKAKVDIFYLLD
jgi:hypothetical protein